MLGDIFLFLGKINKKIIDIVLINDFDKMLYSMKGYHHG